MVDTINGFLFKAGETFLNFIINLFHKATAYDLFLLSFLGPLLFCIMLWALMGYNRRQIWFFTKTTAWALAVLIGPVVIGYALWDKMDWPFKIGYVLAVIPWVLTRFSGTDVSWFR